MAIESCPDGSGMATGNPFRLIGFSDLDRNNPCFFGRIVVSAGEQGVPDKNHLADCDAQNVSKFSDPVGFVYALLGDIDGSRPTQAHGKLGNRFIKQCIYLLPLGKVRVPFLLLFQGSLLT